MSEYIEFVVRIPKDEADFFIARFGRKNVKIFDYLLGEEIVRCRDCVKFSEQEPGGEIGTGELGLEDTGLVSIVEPNGFCSWGERENE